jgi:hypothetical protein
VLPGDSYHVAASHAIQCAQATLAFIERWDLEDSGREIVGILKLVFFP